MAEAKTLSRMQRMLNRNSISFYLKEIDKLPLLSRVQEEEIAKLAAEGDMEAKEKLIVSNLRFVVSVAKKYRGHGLPLSDLISEGNLGLITAADKFDHTRGIHFISYAVWWIRQSILKAISEKSRMVRLPMNRANELIKVGRFVESYSKENGVVPSDERISEELDMDKNEITKLRGLSAPQNSLDNLMGDDGIGFEPAVEEGSGYHPDSVAVQSSLRESLDQAMQNLTEREREVIYARFGLDGREPESLNTIGKRMSLTKERIRQIEKMAIEQIRKEAENNSLYAYLS